MNQAELYISLMKKVVSKDMREGDLPPVFWDYYMEFRTRIHNLTARTIFKLNNKKAISMREIIYGKPV